jgi:lantibiotic modifying enzyme
VPTTHQEENRWRPLLDGELAAEAWATVHAIAAALEAAPAGGTARGPDRDVSVAGGRAGIALFHAYLADAFAADPGRESGRADHQAELAGLRLDESIEALATVPMGAGLYGGFPGIAWAAEHLSRRVAAEAGDEEDDEDPNAEIDEALAEALARSPWTDSYDLIEGLVGLGVYAVERFPRPSGVRCLEAVIDRLDELAEHRVGDGGDEITWFTPPELLAPMARETTPEGNYNLGVAHGVPGVIALLGEACRLGVRAERARHLLDGAVRWLFAQRLPASGGFGYSAVVAAAARQEVERQPSRMAWCYGDPGIAATLLSAARAAGRADWEREAFDLGARAAAATPERAGVRDAGLCHGAFGLAHLYNRLYQAGGGEPFAEAARAWVRRGLALRRPEYPLAGFAAWHPGEDLTMGWQDDPGFLTGVAGIGLALVACLSAIEPEWDRLLQVAVPPAGPPAAP